MLEIIIFTAPMSQDLIGGYRYRLYFLLISRVLSNIISRKSRLLQNLCNPLPDRGYI
ncbi:hypothetical protein D3C81_1376900 [compost metagenome]